MSFKLSLKSLFGLFLVLLFFTWVTFVLAQSVRISPRYFSDALGCHVSVSDFSPSTGIQVAEFAIAPLGDGPASLIPSSRSVRVSPDRYRLTAALFNTQSQLLQGEETYSCIAINARIIQVCNTNGTAQVFYTIRSVMENPLRWVSVQGVFGNRYAYDEPVGEILFAKNVVLINLPLGVTTRINIRAQGDHDEASIRGLDVSCPPAPATITPVPPSAVPPTLPPPDVPAPTATLAIPIALNEHLTCPAGSTPVAIQLEMETMTTGDPRRSYTIAVPFDSPNGSFVVASMVGHPEVGCPDSNDPLCTQNQTNEEFNVFADSATVAFFEDHGENKWETRTFPYPLSDGDHLVEFVHTQRNGPDEPGSVGFEAAYCALGN